MLEFFDRNLVIETMCAEPPPPTPNVPAYARPGDPERVPPHPEGDNGVYGGLKSERTRQRILDAAARTFRNQGFAGTTLNDIANAAQLRAGSIYYHFDSKERLLEEVLDIGIARVATAVKAVVDGLPPETSPTERIRHGIEAHLRSLLHQAEYTSATFRIFWQAPPDARERILRRRQDYADYWRGLLQSARAAGEIEHHRDLGLARMFLFGALNWSVEWYDRERGPLDAFVREAAETFLRGITKSSRPRETEDRP